MSLTEGEKVTGTPVVDEVREKYTNVVGHYHKRIISFGDKAYANDFVVVGDELVPCYDIRKATRREKETESISV